MQQINVMIVDDSAFVRKVMEEILTTRENIKVVAKARNGVEALEKLKRHKIDVITMDVEMPEMNGLEALEAIMHQCPTPVVMVSNYTRRGTEETLRALEIGAVDFVAKPTDFANTNLDELKEKVIEKVRIAAVARLQRRNTDKGSSRPVSGKGGAAPKIGKIVAIGASTGGPKALQEVLAGLPDNLDAAILVVQHMPHEFTRSFAERLDSICQLEIKEAEDGEIIRTGCGYIAPGGFHMRAVRSQVDNNCIIKLGKDQAVSGHRPSVDVLFESLSNLGAGKIAAVIMTGMGSDGAKGMKMIKEKVKCFTLAQDEETSIVFGMPRSAIKLGIVDKVVPLKSIAGEITRYLEV